MIGIALMIAGLFCSASASAIDEDRQLVIIDTDGGSDDVAALLFALHYESQQKIKILGISVVGGGNTNMDRATSNTLRALKLAGNASIPVYRGCNTPLLNEEMETASVFDVDGIGGISDRIAVDLSQVKQGHAVTWLYDTVNANPGKITLIALGPLTNLAMVQNLHPDFARKLKSLQLMGGAMGGEGNTSPLSEFNIYCDPESAYIVFNKFDCPITIFGWDTTMKHGMPWAWYNSTIRNNSHSSLARLISDMYEYTITNFGIFAFVSADLFAVITFFEPSIVTKTASYHTNIELNGALSRGQMVVDRFDILKRPKNANFTVEYDINSFKSLMIGFLDNFSVSYNYTSICNIDLRCHRNSNS